MIVLTDARLAQDPTARAALDQARSRRSGLFVWRDYLRCVVVIG